MSDDLFDDDLFSEFDDDDDTFDDDDADNTAERLAEFDKEVDRRMKIILTRKRDLDERVEAAYWLGNSGAPKAITALRKVYRGDKNPQMKKATGYALGQFKALDEAIERDFGDSVLDALGEERNAHIVELLQEIALGDKASGSKPGGGWARRLVGVLTFTLVILIGLNVLLMGDTSEDDTPTASDPLAVAFAVVDDANIVITDQNSFDTLNTLRMSTVSLEQAALTLRQLTDNNQDSPAAEAAATAEVSPTLPACPLAVTIPDDLTTPSTNFEIGDIVTEHNRTAGMLRLLNDQTAAVFCEDGRLLNAGEVQRNESVLSDIDTQITAIRSGIEAQLPTVIATVTPPAEATAEPTVITDTPSPVANPSLEPSVARAYTGDLLNIISQVNARDGAASLLLQYWEDVETGGRTEGCELNQPSIPLLDAVPDDVVAAPDDTLERAWVQLNNGLDQLQTGWDLFRAACDSPEPIGEQLALGIATARNARDLIQSSNTLLISGDATPVPNTDG